MTAECASTATGTEQGEAEQDTLPICRPELEVDITICEGNPGFAARAMQGMKNCHSASGTCATVAEIQAC